MSKINGHAFLDRLTELRKSQDEVHSAAAEVAKAMRALSQKQKKANGKSPRVT